MQIKHVLWIFFYQFEIVKLAKFQNFVVGVIFVCFSKKSLVLKATYFDRNVDK